MGQKEIELKNAALWMHYSHLLISGSVKSDLLDNGARMVGEGVFLTHAPGNNSTAMDKKAGIRMRGSPDA